VARAVRHAVCIFLVLTTSAAYGQSAPPAVFPEGYAKPIRLDAGPFWRVHRFDLERCVDDRNSLKGCVETREECQAQRLEDVTHPPEGLQMTWWQATLAGVVTIVATLLAKKGIEDL